MRRHWRWDHLMRVEKQGLVMNIRDNRMSGRVSQSGRAMVMLLMLLRLLGTTGHKRHIGGGPMVHDLRLT